MIVRVVAVCALFLLLNANQLFKREADEVQDHDLTEYCHNMSMYAGESYCKVFNMCCDLDHMMTATQCANTNRTCLMDTEGNITETACMLTGCFLPVYVENNATASDNAESDAEKEEQTTQTYPATTQATTEGEISSATTILESGEPPAEGPQTKAPAQRPASEDEEEKEGDNSSGSLNYCIMAITAVIVFCGRY